MTKTDITKRLQELRKAGWKVVTFNDRRATSSGAAAAGWPDHVLFLPRRGIIVFAEIKLGHDKLSVKQATFRSWISNELYKAAGVHYILISEKNIDVITDALFVI